MRVHTDARADVATAAVGARAFTVGADVVFRQGEFAPHNESGCTFFAHELVHVAQTSGAGVGSPSFPTRVSVPTDAAEREADYLSRGSAFGAIQPSPPRVSSSGMLLPQLQSQLLPQLRSQLVRADFHDPNFCYRPGVPRDSTHPDLSRVVAVMQAEIVTPTTCNGTMVLRTSVLQSAWGAASAEFESLGGGDSQGLYQGIHRDDAAERRGLRGALQSG